MAEKEEVAEGRGHLEKLRVVQREAVDECFFYRKRRRLGGRDEFRQGLEQTGNEADRAGNKKSSVGGSAARVSETGGDTDATTSVKLRKTAPGKAAALGGGYGG